MGRSIYKKLICVLPLVTLLLSGCNKHNNNSSSGGSDTPTPPGRYNIVEIYATNDFHGQVKEENNYMGLKKWATYLNEKGKNPNTLLLDQGDTWQGSIYSNYNHGELITDVMNYIHYDARSVGNHDFDWGVEYLASNTARSYQGYSTPVLAGNVYDYDFDTKTIGTEQQSNLGRKSVTYVLDNGLKVGILGGIGHDQISSICSLYTKDICFTDHIQFIKDEATHLRNDEHCDVVIASIHTGQEDVKNNGLSRYVDLVLCGHTHQEESSCEGALWYSQNKAYGQSIGHITLTYDNETKEVTKTTIDCISANTVKSSVTEIDSGVNSLVDTYNAQCDTA